MLKHCVRSKKTKQIFCRRWKLPFPISMPENIYSLFVFVKENNIEVSIWCGFLFSSFRCATLLIRHCIFSILVFWDKSLIFAHDETFQMLIYSFKFPIYDYYYISCAASFLMLSTNIIFSFAFITIHIYQHLFVCTLFCVYRCFHAKNIQ